jgi:hypothetical protein
MAFRRSPVRSRSGPPSFAHECRRRMPRRSVAERREAAPTPRRGDAGPRRYCGTLAAFPSIASQKLLSSQRPSSIPQHFSGGCFRHLDCLHALVPGDKRFVYVLKNADPEPDFYVGLTSDVRARLSEHNTGRCPHTASRRPGSSTLPLSSPMSREPSASSVS